MNTKDGPLLLPLASEKSEHINELVTHQKKSRKRNSFIHESRPFLTKSNNRRNSSVKKRSSVSCNTEVKKLSKSVEKIGLKNCPTKEQNTLKISLKQLNALTSSTKNSLFSKINMKPELNTETELLLCNSTASPTAMEPLTTSSPKSTSISNAGGENKTKATFNCTGETESSSICGSVRQDLLYINEKLKENFRTLLSFYPSGMSCSKLAGQYKEKFGVPLDIGDLGFTSVREMIISLPTVFTFEKQKHSQDWVLYDARINPKRRSIDDEWIPTLVVDNMAELAQAHPDGIPGCVILNKYREKFGVDLDLDVLGFKSTQSFLVCCKSITAKIEGDKCIVYPKHWRTNKIELSEKPSEYDSALPPFEDMKFIWEPYFKDNMCDIAFKYKRIDFPFGEKMVNINISDVFSPSLLWLQVFNSLSDLNTMMYQLNTFYDEKEGDYILEPCVIQKGLACAVKFSRDNRWHRGLVESLSDDNSTADIFYVDYGTRLRAEVSEVRALHKKFGEYPRFAIKASFYNLEPPPDGNGEYPLSSYELLFYVYTDQPLFVEVVRANVEEPSLEIILYDDDMNVDNLLVRLGCAAKKSKEHKQEKKSAKKYKLLDSYSVKETPKMEKQKLNGVELEQIQTLQPPYGFSEPPIKPRNRLTIITSVVLGETVYLISHQKKVYVLWDQIVDTFANGIPDNLCERRLQSKNLKVNPIVIGKEEPLYEEVRARCGHKLELKSDIHLIPLSEVGLLMRCMASYSPSVTDIFVKLAKECTPDHENWYEQ